MKLQEAIEIIDNIPEDRLAPQGKYSDGSQVCPALALALHWEPGIRTDSDIGIRRVGMIIAGDQKWAYYHITSIYDNPVSTSRIQARDRVVNHLSSLLPEAV